MVLFRLTKLLALLALASAFAVTVGAASLATVSTQARKSESESEKAGRAVRTMAHSVQKAETTTQPRVIKSEPLQDADAKWVGLRRLTYLDPDGKERPWESCERKTRRGEVDAVIIFPILLSGKKAASLGPVEDDRETVLVLQFRPPVGKIVVELPAGLVDANESVEEAAKRELAEETGFVAKGVLQSSPVAYADPGMSNANLRLVFLEVDKDDERNVNPKPKLEAGEFIETVVVRLRDLYTTLEDYQRKEYAIDARLMSFALGLNAL